MHDSVRRVIFDAQVGTLVGAGPRAGLFGTSTYSQAQLRALVGG